VRPQWPNKELPKAQQLPRNRKDKKREKEEEEDQEKDNNETQFNSDCQ